MNNYLLRHAQVFFYALGQLARAPLASLMTITVIGISLALPMGLYVLLDNLQRVGQGWDSGVQISLFLKSSVSQRDAEALADKLRAMPEVSAVTSISPDAALEEFKRLSGFGDALEAVGSNPLPGVLTVRPASTHNSPAETRALATRLGALGQVDLAQLDMEWIKRLNVLIHLAQRGVLILCSLLALGVVLIIGNTIRLAVLNRRTEIEVIKLIGGTNAFIRRPFLYSGLLQGLLGALVARLLLAVSLALLAGPIQELSGLYGSRFALTGLDAKATGMLLLGGAILGWLGSRLAVGRHLREIEPR